MNPFQYRTIHQGAVVEVWLGPPDHPESEFVLAVAKSYPPQLIAALRSAQDAK